MARRKAKGSAAGVAEVADPLYAVAQRSINLIERQLVQLEREQTEREVSGLKFSAEHAENAARLGRALAQVVKEARSLEKDAHRRASRLTPPQKRAVFVEWFESQLPEHQRKLLQELTRVYNARRIGGKATGK